MSIKTYRPTTPARRGMTVSGFDGIEKHVKPEKSLLEVLKKIGVEGKALIVTENVDEKVYKSARNIDGVYTTISTILSPYMILTNGVMVVDKAALAKIEEVYA